MVALGTLVSAFWILSANSWMQTPTGYAVNAAGQFIAVDWWKLIFNPSFPYRLVHMVLAAYLTTAFVVGAVGAYHLLKDSRREGPRVMFSMAMWMAALVAPIQIFAGDQHGLNTLEHQPVKVMAMEGHFKSHPDGAPLILFGLPDQAAGEMKYSVEIPKASSLILKHSLDAPLKGLDTVPRDELAQCAHRVLGIPHHGRHRLPDAGARPVQSLFARGGARFTIRSWLHRYALTMGPAGFIAVLAGWTTTEAGRQPFTVYGLAAHCGLRIAARSSRGRIIADRLHHRVFHRVRHGRVLPAATDERAAASWRTGSARATFRRAPQASRRQQPSPRAER